MNSLICDVDHLKRRVAVASTIMSFIDHVVWQWRIRLRAWVRSPVSPESSTNIGYFTEYCVAVSDVAGRRHSALEIHQSLLWVMGDGDCFTCPLQHGSRLAAPSVVVSSLLLVLQSGIHCLTICAIQLLNQTSFKWIWNSLVCLLLAFRWQCVSAQYKYTFCANCSHFEHKL